MQIESFEYLIPVFGPVHVTDARADFGAERTRFPPAADCLVDEVEPVGHDIQLLESRDEHLQRDAFGAHEREPSPQDLSSILGVTRDSQSL